MGQAHTKHEYGLDNWIDADWSDGIDVTTLCPLDHVTVTTLNSVYTLIVVSPHSATAQVRGGALLSQFTTVRVCGSSLGHGPLKLRVIHPGFCLELSHDELGLIVTSPVQSVVVSHADDAALVM
jgi:hypothetical protein